jgi:hypothetical protein
LTGKDSVITFKISSTSIAGDVEGASSSVSVVFRFRAEAFFFEAAIFGLGLISFSSKFLHPFLLIWQLLYPGR